MKEKIIVIEDDGEIRKNLTILLEEEGYVVKCAADGKTGLSMISNEKPDLIICDIVMPGISGHEVFNEVNKIFKSPQIPFIFLTAKTDKDFFRFSMNLGADDYIFKPYKAKELLNSVKLRLNRKK